MKILIFTIVFLSSCLFSFSQENAKPQKGDGIRSFLKRHNRTTQTDYDNFIQLNKTNLGKNKTLILGKTYLLPPLGDKTPTTQTKKEPLFGEKYAEYTVNSNRLKGTCYFLVSGHGGPDPGAIGKIDGYDLHEDEYAYDVILRLARNLLQEGATVHIIIKDENDGIRDDRYLPTGKNETCMGKEIPKGQEDRLKQQCVEINKLSKASKINYQRSIFIHLDSRAEKKEIDVFFYHFKTSVKGIQLANTLSSTLQENYKKHQPNRKDFSGTVETRDLYVLSKSRPVAVFAELGNIQNEFDQKRFLESSNRQALANWLCQGLIKDYENQTGKK